MAKYRHDLPQLAGGMFLTDGGLETDLIFNKGFDLPAFAAFPLLDEAEGRWADAAAPTTGISRLSAGLAR